ncbi:hypothetical protein HXX76_012344 [Chlamydomonas incerta]|uniref:Expansin-like EG45 domain-containing protein n=1 Tax=Chlamydomonas incerta TaxID=51695 RepID=A0A835VVI4_CHLIN|nr:hypothetical protein HXX76_012344 [Chlamydomonas incerta]|eukprot:KAG2427408.1 hypothetical protein HXX76_012344 [Chlamydomonas incerta]
MSAAIAIAVVALFAHMGAATAAIDWQWHTGRATHYGGAGDPWSIHNGHCGYGYLDPNVGTGWDIAAPSDQNWDYDSSTSNCGVCYEISCNGMDFSDFYGNYLERTDVCYNGGETSVVVMVSDVCPCYYPSNQYSNKRWCCGDMQHFDVSVFAFEKLADVKWGVIGIKYRRVPCDYKPAKRAYRPSSAPGAQESTSAPWNWDSSKDKRWTLWSQKQSWNFGDATYSSTAGLQVSASSPSSSSDSSSSSSSGGSSSVGQQSSVTNAYYGGFMQGWSDSGSWGLSKWDRDSSWGFDGQQAYCATLSGYGGAKFNAWSGALSSKRTLEFWVRMNDGAAPDVTIKLASPNGGCKDVRLRDLTPNDSKAGWQRYWVQLTSFDWRGRNDGGAFGGCSDSVSDWDVNTLFFVNSWGSNQYLCLDQIKLF